MALVGYARVSTGGQSLTAQIAADWLSGEMQIVWRRIGSRTCGDESALTRRG
jgi:DNA invertase Pin-like site-specific DNA recombinase